MGYSQVNQRPVEFIRTTLIGGVLILLIERRADQARIHEVGDMNWRDALKVGFAQALGTRRQASDLP